MNSKQSGEAPKFGKLMPNQLSMFQHPDAPNLRISDNDGVKHSVASLRSPKPTRPVSGKTDSLFPPRDVSKARSLSPAPSRPRPPQLPTGVTSQLGSTQKKSVLGDTGAAKLFEKATELRSSLDVPSFRVPIVRDEETKDSVSLPSSPMSSRKIGLSYMTPPSSRKMGSCRSPTAKESSPAPVSVTCELVWPAPGSSSPPSASVKTVKTSISRSSSPGPFTSVLKSGSLGEDAVNKSVHYESKERGGDRISRFDTHASRDSGYSGSGSGSNSLLVPKTLGSGGKRGVSPTPLGNLKLYQHPDIST